MTVSKLIVLWVTLLPKGTPGFGGTLLLGHTLLLGVTLLLEATLPFNEYSTTCALGLTPRPFHTISCCTLSALFTDHFHSAFAYFFYTLKAKSNSKFYVYHIYVLFHCSYQKRYRYTINTSRYDMHESISSMKYVMECCSCPGGVTFDACTVDQL